ncbi:DUF1692-domain-containing protein [Auriscalpium vulgare]|uniref:DUF1692-domain-containing protein n=1 Tax=Auriscalpium vulgare TaxID=40419 RepID=A0ACB8S2Y8_9AGAM|nr:DUF1692-domain-containing protein [Auriscalpium vulgare]
MATTTEQSLLDKLDSVSPAPLTAFDAFPKLPSTYKARSESRGFFTIVVSLVAFLLVLNDIGEFLWGWPDHEFSVDHDDNSYMSVNVDLVVNMPCRYLSVDLRDAVADRLYLSKGFRRDGVLFDVGQATTLKEHAAAISARQAVSQSRKSRGFFSAIAGRPSAGFSPTYNHEAADSACRIFGSLDVKKVSANLHITTLGHGYASNIHVPHHLMNMSHVITEFSFGPFFPEIAQPLDNSFEITHDPFVAYQYFLRVVPTTYVAPRSNPLDTNQYSVTHYTRVLEHNRGTPGIFFKFDIEPIRLSVIQRTTTFAQFFIRWAGVVGGVFVCASWGLRVSNKAFVMVAGPDDSDTITPTDSARTSGLRTKWGGSSLRTRPAATNGRVLRQGNSWVVEGGSPYSSYAGTPNPTTPYTPASVASPYSPAPPPSRPVSGNFSAGARPVSGNFTGLGLSPGVFGPGARSPVPASAALPTAATVGSPYLPSASTTPAYPNFPPTPASGAFPNSAFSNPSLSPRPPPTPRDRRKDD